MKRVRRATLAWILTALLGLVVAAGVMAAASHLSSQRVGLASEPPSAGDRLAPQRTPVTNAPAGRARRLTTPSTKVPTTPTRPAAPASTDEGHTSKEGDGDSDGDD